MLHDILPSEDEISLITAYTKDMDRAAIMNWMESASRCELFFFIMKDVNQIKSRVHSWKFMLEFSGNMNRIIQDLTSIELTINACLYHSDLYEIFFLRDSHSLKVMFGLILRIGQHLNNDLAYGFRLSTLKKVSDSVFFLLSWILREI